MKAIALFYLAVLMLMLVVTLTHAAPVRDVSIPDPKLTPGATRIVTVTELCTAGSSKLYRKVTASVSKKVYTAYGLNGNHTGYCLDGCELDHDISIELGGSNDPSNLFPMPYTGACNARQKDRLENKLHRLMCKGDITLKHAQRAIRRDWRIAYAKYVDPNGCQPQ